jgi:hypothetical protein
VIVDSVMHLGTAAHVFEMNNIKWRHNAASTVPVDGYIRCS